MLFNESSLKGQIDITLMKTIDSNTCKEIYSIVKEEDYYGQSHGVLDKYKEYLDKIYDVMDKLKEN